MTSSTYGERIKEFWTRKICSRTRQCQVGVFKSLFIVNLVACILFFHLTLSLKEETRLHKKEKEKKKINRIVKKIRVNLSNKQPYSPF